VSSQPAPAAAELPAAAHRRAAVFTGTAKRVYTIDLDDLDQPPNLDVRRRVFADPDSFRPAVRGHPTTPFAGRRAEVEQHVLANLLRMNQGTAEVEREREHRASNAEHRTRAGRAKEASGLSK